MTEQELKEIRERLEAATPGKWFQLHFDDVPSDVVNTWDDSKSEIEDKEVCRCESEADAEFIAHAIEDICRLLDEVERLREKDRKFIDWLYKKREEKRKSAQNSYDAVAGTLFEVEAEMMDEVIQKLSSE